MIEIQPTRWSQEPYKPLPEQIVGVKHLLSSPRAAHGGSYTEEEPIGTILFDEQGVAKTRQAIDAACTAFDAGLIDTVVIVAPASVRGVWDVPDPLLGEIAKFCWVPYQTERIDRKFKGLQWPPKNTLQFLITSYGFLRKKTNKKFPTLRLLNELLSSRKAWVFFDESAAIKGHESLQSQSALLIRQVEGIKRISELNGTPISNGPLDLWNQMMVCDPQMIAVDSETKELNVNGTPLTFTQFRSKYCLLVLKSLPNRRPFYDIVGENREELAKLKKHVRPWILRRRLDQVLNLPPKIYTHLEAELDKDSWRIYCEMRDTLVAFFQKNPSQAKNGAVKTVRLAQITSGFLGGVEIIDKDSDFAKSLGVDFNEDHDKSAIEIGRAKLDTFLEYRASLGNSSPVISWSRFTRELKRVSAELTASGQRVGEITGGQSDNVRQDYINAFQRGELHDLVGNAQAGGLGLNLTQAHVEIYLSNDHNLITRLQSESRTHRRGQTKQVHIVDIVAVGPSGQRTIDFAILKSLRAKKDLADWTASDWIRALKDE